MRCVKNNLVGGGRLHLPVFLLIALIHEGLKESINNSAYRFSVPLWGGGGVCLLD